MRNIRVTVFFNFYINFSLYILMPLTNNILLEKILNFYNSNIKSVNNKKLA